MPDFKVKVTITATFEYEVTASGRNERRAVDNAIAEFETHLPADFKVASGYCEFESETEQLTEICRRCYKEHAVPTAANSGRIVVDGQMVLDPDIEWWDEDQDYCAACGLLEAASAS